jgi:hypothetical protein
MADDGVVRAAVRAIVGMLLATVAPEYLREDVEVTVRSASGRRLWAASIHPNQLAVGSGPPGPEGAESPGGLTDTQQAILAVLQVAERPVKIVTIASRANKVFNSHFRAAVRGLVRAGKVAAAGEGRYWLAARGKPPAGH